MTWAPDREYAGVGPMESFDQGLEIGPGLKRWLLDGYLQLPNLVGVPRFDEELLVEPREATRAQSRFCGVDRCVDLSQRRVYSLERKICRVRVEAAAGVEHDIGIVAAAS